MPRDPVRCDCCGAEDIRSCKCSPSYCFLAFEDEKPPGGGNWCPIHCPCSSCRLSRGDRAAGGMR